jgi:hypothetical protein
MAALSSEDLVAGDLEPRHALRVDREEPLRGHEVGQGLLALGLVIDEHHLLGVVAAQQSAPNELERRRRVVPDEEPFGVSSAIP